jgi:hypothetical protein
MSLQCCNLQLELLVLSDPLSLAGGGLSESLGIDLDDPLPLGDHEDPS